MSFWIGTESFRRNSCSTVLAKVPEVNSRYFNAEKKSISAVRETRKSAVRPEPQSDADADDVRPIRQVIIRLTCRKRE